MEITQFCLLGLAQSARTKKHMDHAAILAQENVAHLISSSDGSGVGSQGQSPVGVTKLRWRPLKGLHCSLTYTSLSTSKQSRHAFERLQTRRRASSSASRTLKTHHFKNKSLAEADSGKPDFVICLLSVLYFLFSTHTRQVYNFGTVLR
jgi:hypothetical protein